MSQVNPRLHRANFHVFTFHVMIEYLEIVLAQARTDPFILKAVTGVHFSFKTFIEHVRQHMDVDQVTPEISADFGLMLEAVQATNIPRIRTKQTLHKRLRLLIEIAGLLELEMDFDRNQLATIVRLKDCLCFLADKGANEVSDSRRRQRA